MFISFGAVHILRLQEEGGRLSKWFTFCKLSYHRKCKRRGVGGQKKTDFVNVVCERPLTDQLITKSSMISNLYFGVYNAIEYDRLCKLSNHFFYAHEFFFFITFQKVAKHPFLLLPFCKESSRQHWWCQLSHSLFSCWSQNQVLKNDMFPKLSVDKYYC